MKTYIGIFFGGHGETDWGVGRTKARDHSEAYDWFDNNSDDLIVLPLREAKKLARKILKGGENSFRTGNNLVGD